MPQFPHWSDIIHIKSRQDLPHLGLVLFLVLGIFVGVYLSLQPQLFSKRAAEGSVIELRFEPEVLQVRTGGVYEAKIGINPKGERVTAAQLEINYNPGFVTILDTKNEGFLPVTLKAEDDFKGNLRLTYGSTFESKPVEPGIITTIRFRVSGLAASEIAIKSTSQVSVSSKEGNVLTAFPVLRLEAVEFEPDHVEPVDTTYPNNLLQEVPVLPNSSPFLRDFKEASEPKPELKPERVEPGLSAAYLKQLGKDIFVEPIVALNEVIQERAAEVLRPE